MYRRATPTRPSAAGLKQALQLTAKEAIWWAAARHRQGRKPNILVFGSRRGGSTWVMQLIESQPGIRSLNEPYSVHRGGTLPPLLLPKVEAEQFVSFADASEEDAFRRYTEDLLSGKSAAGAPWRLWEHGYTFTSDRIVVKDLHAKALIDWFHTNFDLDIVYLTRHPIPQAMSFLRLGWGLTTRAYLRNPDFSQLLGSERAMEAARIVDDGTELEQAVLAWVIENYVPLTLLPRRPAWTWLSYEECVLEPGETLQRMAGRLQLEHPDRMRCLLNVPSRSSAMSLDSTRTSIASGQSAAKLSEWRPNVTPHVERSLLAILERFGVPLYVPDCDTPQPWWPLAVGCDQDL